MTKLTKDQIATITAFITAKATKPILLSNDALYTNSNIDDDRLVVLRGLGIYAITGGAVTVTYNDGKTITVPAPLALGAALAGVKYQAGNITDSLAKGKFIARGNQIIFSNDEVRAINDARNQLHEEKVVAESDALQAFISSLALKTVDSDDLPLLYILFNANAIVGADESGLWVASPNAKLDIPGLISLEVVKGRTTYEHKVALETAIPKAKQ